MRAAVKIRPVWCALSGTTLTDSAFSFVLGFDTYINAMASRLAYVHGAMVWRIS